MSTPALNRNSVILGKVESTYGTDPTPTVSANAILGTVPQINLDARILERSVTVRTLSPTAHIIGRKLVPFSYGVEFKSEQAILAGSSSAPLQLDAILRASGFTPTYEAETSGGADDGYVTYAPRSTGLESLTHYFFPGNEMRHIVKGAFLDFNIEIAAGQYAMMNVNGKGIYTQPTDTSASALTLAPDEPTPVESISLAFGAITGTVVRNLNIAMNNEIVERDDVNSAEGFKGLRLTGRKPILKFRMEKELAATWNIYSALDAGTSYATTFTIGSVAGKKILVTIPKLVLSSISESDDAGIVMLDVEALCARDSDSGDDEITFKFF
jgi:hypothetical protein